MVLFYAIYSKPTIMLWIEYIQEITDICGYVFLSLFGNSVYHKHIRLILYSKAWDKALCRIGVFSVN
jgi:hypothetical protein